MAVSAETKVGAFFLFALLVFGWFSFRVADLGEYLRPKRQLRARFAHAAGLRPGDGVSVAGLRVGDIQEIRLLDDGVEVVMLMDSAAKVRTSSIAVVAWGGLLGNRYIDISLGNPGDELLRDGDLVRTEPSIEIGEVLRKLDAAASGLQNTLQNTNLGGNLSNLVENLLSISKDIREGKGALGKFVSSPELHDKALGIANDLKKTSEKLAALIEKNEARISSLIEQLEKAAPEAREAFANIKDVAKNVQEGKGILPALIQDEKMYEDLKGSLARLNASLDNIDSLTKAMREGEGLLGRLTYDKQLAQDVQEAVASLKSVAERIEKGDSTLARLTRDKDLYDDVKKVLDDARETLRSAKEQVPVGTFASVLLSAF